MTTVEYPPVELPKITSIGFRLTGISSLIMHNGQLADHDNEWTKAIAAITSKKTKTTEDREKLCALEFMGGLYLNPERNKVVIPVEVLDATLLRGARQFKLGLKYQAGVIIEGDDDDNIPLIYPGQLSPYTGNLSAMGSKLYDGERCRYYKRVGVNRKAVMRMRPRFRTWSLEFKLQCIDSIINAPDMVKCVHAAGTLIGLAERRPRCGRFTVEVIS